MFLQGVMIVLLGISLAMQIIDRVMDFNTAKDLEELEEVVNHNARESELMDVDLTALEESMAELQKAIMELQEEYTVKH